MYEKSIESMTLGYPKLKNMIKNYGKKYYIANDGNC